MFPNRSHHQVMRDVVKESFDVHVDHPIMFPATLPRKRYGLPG